MKPQLLHTSGLLICNKNSILLAYSTNKKAWYLPGGKIEKGETALQALVREIQEEINVTLDVNRLSYFCHITAPAYGEKQNISMEQECFKYKLLPEEKPTPSKEIEELRFFDLETYKKEKAQVPGVLQLFNLLFNDTKEDRQA
ncbi:NUDIX domain-containing protein [Apibacter raozihei]|uniref:NUDIX hydrolase n=1 Tax=Apibacter TaxID=1778601 RepID=UPI000FE2B07F|nr:MULTISPECIES: NUDIX domain-containing protein [Apibacter]